MKLNFNAVQAKALTTYYNELHTIQRTIERSARRGNLNTFVEVPLPNYNGMKNSIEKAGYKVTKRGNVTINGKHKVVIEIEW